MTVYTVKQADDSWSSILERAETEGEVGIQNEEGRLFVLRPESRRSPLDVEGVDLGLSREEIVSIVRASRERSS